MVPDGKLVDAPARGLTLDDVLPMADDYELAVLHTSTPSFKADLRVAEALKARNPKLSIERSLCQGLRLQLNDS